MHQSPPSRPGRWSPLEGQTPSGATAHAGAMIQVLIQGKDGAPDEVIEVVRPSTEQNDESQEQAPTAVTSHVTEAQQP